MNVLFDTGGKNVFTSAAMRLKKLSFNSWDQGR
jgi:hypothetical protein